MHLATNFITVGMPYIASFLPGKECKKIYKALGIEEILLKDPVSGGQIDAARKELEKLAENVVWETDYDIYDTMNAWGMNILTNQKKPWHHETWEEIAEYDKKFGEKSQHPKRSVKIGIAAQYVDFIEEARPDSEERIRATWHAAITMVHEIGHYIWNFNTENTAKRWTREFKGSYAEPYVGDMCLSELGIAFVAWIFDGHTPTTIATDKLDNPFKRPLIWRKEKTLADAAKHARLPYVVYWSMRTDYLERHLTHSFWAQMGDQQDVNFSRKARARMAPVKLSGVPAPATAFIRDWELVDNVPVWKAEFWDRSPRPNTLWTLRPVEIAIARSEDQSAENAKMVKRDNASMENPRWMENRAKIDDGIILQDISKEDPEENPEENSKDNPREKPKEKPLPVVDHPTAIEVRFKSLTKPSGDGTKSEIYNSYERWKYGLEVPEEYYDQVHRVWEFTSQLNIANRFTRAQGAEYCKLHDLGTFFDIPASRWEQSKKLSPSDELDLKIIERIRCHLLGRVIAYWRSTGFGGMVDVLAVIIYQDIVQIADSGILTIGYLRKIVETLERGEANEDRYSGWGERERLQDMVKEAMSTRAEALSQVVADRLDPDPETAEEIFQSMLKDLREGRHRTDPLYTPFIWSDDDWETFFAQHKLPTWGNKEVYMERYYAYEYERKYGFPRYCPLFSDHADRWRATGEEMYRFYADIDNTSVGALKNAIYTKGHFPAKSNLVLRIFNGGLGLLRDSDSIAEALGGKKPTLILEVDEPVPQAPSKEEPELQLWNRPQAVHRLTSNQKKEDLVLARYDNEQIPWLDTNMTMEERFKHIRDSAILLEQAMEPDNGNPGAKTSQPMGASVLLEQWEDYEDILEKRLRGGNPTRGEMLDLIAEEEDKKKRKSHMREYVNAVKRRNIGKGVNKKNWDVKYFAEYRYQPPEDEPPITILSPGGTARTINPGRPKEEEFDRVRAIEQADEVRKAHRAWVNRAEDTQADWTP